MTSLTDLLAQGTSHAWLFIPTAILIGALHGLEPGHYKTMMAAFTGASSMPSIVIIMAKNRARLIPPTAL